MPKNINSWTRKEILRMIKEQSEKDKKEIYCNLDKLRNQIIDLNDILRILGRKK